MEINIKQLIDDAQCLNEILQKYLNSGMSGSEGFSQVAVVKKFGTTYAEGDKVIQTQNNYDKDVYIGDLGQITRIDNEDGVLAVNFDSRGIKYEFGELDELSLAYAVSIHKSQGSESMRCYPDCHAALYASSEESL